MDTVAFSIVTAEGSVRPVRVAIEGVVLAGYTGRDREKVLHHIEELEALGVSPPPRVPMFYPVDPRLLTSQEQIQVQRAETSGEVEVYLVGAPHGMLVGVGSDHTDRAHEAVDVAESKRLCQKLISSEVWPYDEVKEYWDRLQIRSWSTDGGGRRLYQEGSLDALLPVEELLREMRNAGHGEIEGRIVFGGTIPALGGLTFGRRFEIELYDPVRKRQLTRGYDVVITA
jgi:hypothetical protein